jgi:hypothetical protein
MTASESLWPAVSYKQMSKCNEMNSGNEYHYNAFELIGKNETVLVLVKELEGLPETLPL